MVKNYTTKELLEKVKAAKGFTHIPEHWILGVRSKGGNPDEMNDKIFYFEGEKDLFVTTGTTHTGIWGLANFFKWDKRGAAIIKSGIWNYNAYEKSDGVKVRHHKDKMQCLRQVASIFMHRDNNKNTLAEEIGPVYHENNSTNFHLNSYVALAGVVRWLIGRWGVGCIVSNNATKYWQIIKRVPLKKRVSMIIILED
jgi:hypothetical protein